MKKLLLNYKTIYYVFILMLVSANTVTGQTVFEETFGTNYLGHFLLTNLLLEKFNIERIVMVSSELHNPENKSPFAKAIFRPVKELAYPKVDENSTLQKQQIILLHLQSVLAQLLQQ